MIFSHLSPTIPENHKLSFKDLPGNQVVSRIACVLGSKMMMMFLFQKWCVCGCAYADQPDQQGVAPRRNDQAHRHISPGHFHVRT